MSEIKENHSLNMVFPFVVAFLDRGLGILERLMLMTVHSLYSDLLHEVYVGSRKFSWTKGELQVLNREKAILGTFW